MSGWIDRLVRAYAYLAGAIFLGFGLVTLSNPEILEYYAIGVENSEARIAIRAMIGGGETALGAILLGGTRLGFSVSQRCVLAATIFTVVGLMRFGSVWAERSLQLTSQPLREASIEVILGLTGFLALALRQKAQVNTASKS